MSREPQSSDVFEDTRQGLNFLLLVVRVWAISLEMLGRHDKGIRYPGLPGAAVFLFIPIYGCFWEGHDLWPLMGFLGVYFVMCLVHRASVLKRLSRGQTGGHSYYNGVPNLCRRFPRLSEDAAKRYAEPALVAFAGLSAYGLNQPLGVYLIGGAVCLAASDGVAKWSRTEQALDMQDAMIEQQIIAERFRELRGDG